MFLFARGTPSIVQSRVSKDSEILTHQNSFSESLLTEMQQLGRQAYQPCAGMDK